MSSIITDVFDQIPDSAAAHISRIYSEDVKFITSWQEPEFVHNMLTSLGCWITVVSDPVLDDKYGSEPYGRADTPEESLGKAVVAYIQEWAGIEAGSQP